jgi:P27 family predicted phage terminase small subunit
LLKPEDYAALVEHCETWSTYIKAVREVRASGITLVDFKSGRVYKNPALAAAEAAAAQLRASCREFGLTPSSEQNLGKPAQSDGNEDDPFGAQGASA